MAVQRSLFPDAFEVEADALEALEALETDRGLQCIREARQRDPTLPNLDAIETALAWLDERLQGAPPDPERAAEAFLELPRAALPRPAAAFADKALARYGLRHARDGFLDRDERVLEGALLLVAGRFDAARHALSRALRGRKERADLQGYLADACHLAERVDEANARYATALLLDAARVDVHRLRHKGLSELWAELRAVHADAEARELLFGEAWLRGLLHVPAENGWLETSLARLRAETALTGTASAAGRARRFGFLLYLDRTGASGPVDMAVRDEMATLDAERLRRVVAVLRERERRSS
jgi:tetratricopeptide (TPR) repeat protein